MHRRWLVDPAHDGLEVVDVEGPGIEVTIPSDDVERMVVENEFVDGVVLLDQQAKVALLVVGTELGGAANIAFGVGRALEQLPEFIAIALGPANVAPALEYHELGWPRGGVQAPPMQDIPVDHDVVALAIREVAIGRLEHARPLSDIHALVGLGVPVEVGVELVGLDIEHGDVGVEEDRGAIHRGAAALPGLGSAEMAVPERHVIVLFPHDIAHLPRRLHGGGRMDVVQQRRRPGESFVPHEFLGIQSAVGTPEDGVTLARDLAQRVVDRHQRLPRSACSRSMASNSALKLPAPKLFAPLRWMIS